MTREREREKEKDTHAEIVEDDGERERERERKKKMEAKKTEATISRVDFLLLLPHFSFLFCWYFFASFTLVQIKIG